MSALAREPELAPSPEPLPASSHARRRWLGITVALALAIALVAATWLTDFVTLQGEWTIYTATCKGGQWQGTTCTGHLEASERFRFRALKAHREVLFWTVGDTRQESGRYTQCDITDGRTWSCPRNDHAARTITTGMKHGIPMADRDAGHLPFHRVAKWKWEALKRGLPVGRSAAD